MPCRFIHVTSRNSNCREDFSGVGSKFYIFDGRSISRPDFDACETLAQFRNVMQTALANARFVEVEIKPKSGKVTANNNQNGGGFNNIFTCLVARNMEEMSDLARTLNNMSDWGVLVPAGGKYYVLYDNDFGVEFQMDSDSGDTTDSDHGHTLTITCGPMLYSMPKISLDVIAVEDTDALSVPVTITCSTSSRTVEIKNGSTTVTSGNRVHVGSVLTLKVNSGLSTETVTWSDGMSHKADKSRTVYVDDNGVNLTCSIS